MAVIRYDERIRCTHCTPIRKARCLEIYRAALDTEAEAITATEPGNLPNLTVEKRLDLIGANTLANRIDSLEALRGMGCLLTQEQFDNNMNNLKG